MTVKSVLMRSQLLRHWRS